MKRLKIGYKSSKKDFAKKTGVHAMNSLNPRRMRGGIRL